MWELSMSGLVQCSIIYEHIDVIVTVLQYFLGFDKIFTKNASTTKLYNILQISYF